MKRLLLGFAVGVAATIAALVALVAFESRALSAPAQALGGGDGYADFSKESEPPPAPSAPAPSRRDRPMAKKSLGSFGTGEGGGGRGGSLGVALGGMEMEEVQASPVEAPKGAADGDEGGASAPSRSWFPETFLFEPLVVTNDQGQATVPVRIPDRLTRWRVLALAHTRSGEQSGAVTGFQGTLPVYVEPVLPGFLVAGDEVRLPIQVVNTTDREISGPLRVEVSNARALESGGGQVRVPAFGSVLRYAVIRAEKAGTAVLRASFGSEDALVRELPVVPAGRPVRSSAGGTLAAERTLSLSAPAEALSGTSRVRLSVFPGALALLRSELSFATQRSTLADDAYGLLLAGRAPALLANLGETADTAALRKTTLVLQQRALRHARVAEPATATLLAEAALAHPQNAILSRLGERLVGTLAASQRPDGTFQGGNGWTLQRLLVATAEGTRALNSASGTEAGARRAEAARVRAAGAFERYLGQVQDGYTAAAIVASGAASGSVETVLREKIRAAISSSGDGSRYLPVEAGVVRADGVRPSAVEATALAILALRGEKDAPTADLGAYLLANYSPHWGWGDGRTNLSALTAVVEVFKSPLPGQVRVVLEQGGRVITEGTVAPKNAQALLSFEAAAPGSGPFTVRAEPAVPGLGYRVELESWVPWKAVAGNGLELAVAGPQSFQLGEAAVLQLTASGPAHSAWSLRTALPAGVQVDRPALDAQVQSGLISAYDIEDGAVTLRVPERGPGQPFVTQLRVFPTLGGRLNAAASSLSVEGREDQIAWAPGKPWVIR